MHVDGNVNSKMEKFCNIHLLQQQHLLQLQLKYQRMTQCQGTWIRLLSLHYQSHRRHAKICLEVHLFLLCSFRSTSIKPNRHSPFKTEKEESVYKMHTQDSRRQQNKAYVMVTRIKQSWKCIRSKAAGTVLSFFVAFFTASAIASSAFGQVLAQ